MKYLKGIIAGLLIILAVCLFAAGLKGKTAGDQTDQIHGFCLASLV